MVRGIYLSRWHAEICSQGQTQLQNDLLSALATRCDLYIPTLNLQAKPRLRETIAIHALNHVYKKRTRVLKNNERLVNAAKSDVRTEPMEDQGFTRPSVLILLPFRSFALDWFHALVTHASGPKVQIENQARFLSEYGLPPGAEDKLASAPPGTYAEDHVEVLKGNTDDNFRVGVKITKKSMKMFADFYGCDIIMASPLGLRRSIEKEKHADYLSSIEVLVVDQLDVLAMQNWDHLKFIISHLNEMPKDDHDVDFSRIKPWYLDGNSRYLRQSILLSPYETPDTRALFNNLHNVSGKIRTERRWSPLEVPDGVFQDFIKFDCSNPMSEADKRFEYFSTQLFPSIIKSAVQSVQTAVFIPSSFDFVRVHNFFKKSGTSFSVLSEYSSNQVISRARQAFFSGKTAFLLVTERFHFYRRYNIRGIRNLVFYGPPDHAQYYAEYLSYPFLDTGVDVADVSCRCLYSKYDWFALERIAGTIGAKELLSAV
ncbi:DUF1253-domain-containing protein [Fistulina hepatica ATCC 64428]|uniref:U3 small nucleolar RNA-associated protein 25 n=1 Tax=Fistulina hepatica ATCC 64428 TaxID=1128425 RepID=A0A0D7APC6_9AGAR|nr:DUF1253-domain-containing protein [Fistulina hepatica ATCC 64428]